MNKYLEKFFRVFLYVSITILAILFLIPIVWVIVTSLKLPGQVYTEPPIWIPKDIIWTNYVDIFTRVPLLHYGLNSIIVAGLSTIGTLISCSLVAFSLARLKWPGRDFVFLMVLGTMMLPAVVTLIPTYVIYTRLHWVDTYYPLVLPSWLGANAFNIFLLRQFMYGIPHELDEAARMDGASSIRILFQIMYPLSKPALATVTIFSFLGSYNDLLGPAMYITTNIKYTLPMALYALAGTYGQFWPYVMAASVLMTLPIILIFVLFQNQFIRGIQMTGLAGR